MARSPSPPSRALRLRRAAATLVLAAAGCTAAPGNEPPRSTSYEDLVALFDEWRAFQRPATVAGVPDYGVEAMAAQHRALSGYRKRLDAIDPSGWPVAQQVDHRIVTAEMDGLDFDHRVLRPWARDPAFYTMIFTSRSDVPAHEGPVVHGWIDLWAYPDPLTPEAAAGLAARIASIPPLLEQARQTLVGDGRDLWVRGAHAMAAQSADLAAFGAGVAGTSAELEAAVEGARAATDAFRAWLDSLAPSKQGPSGVGRENYTWSQQNVHLLPYTWEEELGLARRELWRAHAALRLEEHRNRDLPELERVATPEEFDRVFNGAVTEFLAFLDRQGIVRVEDYMDAALRERIGTFAPASRPDGLREFFSEVGYRDPVTMRTHGYHWIELARMDAQPHPSPIRREPLLYNIWDARSEGLATGMEEMTMHAGLFDGRPRSRELIWILLAQRAARAIGGLMMHANEWTMEEAVRFASTWTPRGWLPEDGATVWGEQHLYLRQPGYGSSYLVGKVEIEKLMAERATALGPAFTLGGFMEELTAAGVIPVSLVRWELTGDGGEVRGMAASR